MNRYEIVVRRAQEKSSAFRGMVLTAATNTAPQIRAHTTKRNEDIRDGAMDTDRQQPVRHRSRRYACGPNDNDDDTTNNRPATARRELKPKIVPLSYHVRPSGSEGGDDNQRAGPLLSV